ncbi:actin nucleation-promoting factor WAS-like [Macaca thibetana thibetana]|uniref:actin nucleation-promoting factor WAS-like n=1 Tax=Macaca thibetana thibetana TaxID=257877 RepID=UPI0021BC8C19|nr:actin nucleation-promoting factor WAS-like [Macaca thibetana thibetana]
MAASCRKPGCGRIGGEGHGALGGPLLLLGRGGCSRQGRCSQTRAAAAGGAPCPPRGRARPAPGTLSPTPSPPRRRSAARQRPQLSRLAAARGRGRSPACPGEGRRGPHKGRRGRQVGRAPGGQRAGCGEPGRSGR